ncbi:hypothetical protein [Jiangella alba]|uniref:Uncharacterized protein n=1 Tax=Jiangella alba TaxID=561176 RepID=A0A1H5MTD5_9ACTN|nr:hypothetical protein [Jiangella alba]SEE91911.1 hypothetical protein SAMN04488561_3366 [Jiangella alba]
MTLRSRLDDLAADAPGPGALDLDRIRGRIARRRRTRVASASAAVMLTAAMSTVAAAGLLDQGDDAAPPAAGSTPSGLPTVDKSPAPGPQQAFTSRGCGWIVKDQGPAPDSPLRMTVELDDSVDPDDWDEPIGTATITNVSEEPFTGATGPGPDTYVVRDDSVVTEPGPQQASLHGVMLAQGQSVIYPVHSFLRRCTPGDVTQPQDEPLEPGTYQVYVALQFVDAFTLYSGPIEVEVTG